MRIVEDWRGKLGCILLVFGLFSCSSGCGTMRGVEQWKCDNWGMCHFGTQPSAALPPLPPPQYSAPANPNGCPPGYSP
jgi:hypothetical protein